MKRKPGKRSRTVSGLGGIQIAEPVALHAGLFQFIQFQMRILSNEGFYDLGTQEMAVICRMVAKQDAGLCPFLHHNKYPAVDHQVDISPQDVHHLNGTVDYHIFRDIDKQAVLYQHRIQSRQRVFTRRSKTTVMLLQQVGTFLRSLAKRTNHHPLRQRSCRLGFIVESIVHNEIKRRAQIGHITREHIIRIHGNIQTFQVYSVIRCKSRRHIGILVPFCLLCRELQPAEILISLPTMRIQHSRTVSGNHVRIPVKQIYILLFAVHVRLSFHCPATSALIQSKPLFSISVANSGPPDLTIRPSINTCTKSGFK